MPNIRLTKGRCPVEHIRNLLALFALCGIPTEKLQMIWIRVVKTTPSRKGAMYMLVLAVVGLIALTSVAISASAHGPDEPGRAHTHPSDFGELVCNWLREEMLRQEAGDPIGVPMQDWGLIFSVPYGVEHPIVRANNAVKSLRFEPLVNDEVGICLAWDLVDDQENLVVARSHYHHSGQIASHWEIHNDEIVYERVWADQKTEPDWGSTARSFVSFAQERELDRWIVREFGFYGNGYELRSCTDLFGGAVTECAFDQVDLLDGGERTGLAIRVTISKEGYLQGGSVWTETKEGYSITNLAHFWIGQYGKMHTSKQVCFPIEVSLDRLGRETNIPCIGVWHPQR